MRRDNEKREEENSESMERCVYECGLKGRNYFEVELREYVREPVCIKGMGTWLWSHIESF